MEVSVQRPLIFTHHTQMADKGAFTAYTATLVEVVAWILQNPVPRYTN